MTAPPAVTTGIAFDVLQENLAKALDVVAKAEPARSTLPIIGHVLIETDRGRLRLTVTDLEQTVVAWCGARVETEGAITVPVRMLRDVVARLLPGTVRFSLEGNKARLEGGRSVATLPVLNAEDFPRTGLADEGETFELEGTALARALPVNAVGCDGRCEGERCHRRYEWPRGSSVDAIHTGMVRAGWLFSGAGLAYCSERCLRGDCGASTSSHVERCGRCEAIVAYVRAFASERGYAPSIREIGKAIQRGPVTPATSVVSYHLRRLRHAGLIAFEDGLVRTIRVLAS